MLDIELPLDGIARLTRTGREARLTELVADADRILREALAEHQGDRAIVGTVFLFSGGNDSTVLAHLFRDRATHAAHANTTIGIEATRQFVRDTCRGWGLPLIEETAPTSYRELVIERGFPGPAMHWKMYQRLKERCLEAVRRQLVTNPYRERVVFLTGRRRDESKRREDIVEHERRGSTIWASPLANWTSLDLNTYRLLHPDCPTNDVSSLLHMSGECLCGAFARPGELEQIEWWFPDVAAEIRALEADVRAAGHPEWLCRWGHGQGKPSKTGPLCSSCDSRFAQDQLPGIEVA